MELGTKKRTTDSSKVSSVHGNHPTFILQQAIPSGEFRVFNVQN